MRRVKTILPVLLLCTAMLVLILDSKVALQGAQIGLALCAKTVIPSLFPFFVISILLTGLLSSREVKFLRPICRFCKMPPGTEKLLLVGFLGGYPAGAKCIYEAWRNGQISKTDAWRCLGFCNNAGPAFIFGMCGVLFSKPWISWVLYGIHILSALLVGNILPIIPASPATAGSKEHTTLSEAMWKAIIAILSVCGWVVLFRVILAFCQRWFLWLLPIYGCSVFEGLLELTNGCNGLTAIDSEGLRFLLCAVYLGFGGLCVALQTVSMVKELGTGLYFPGKILQCAISGCLAGLFSSIYYDLCSPILPAALLLFLAVMKKVVAFPKSCVYNVEKNQKGESTCYSEKRSLSPAAIAPAGPR